MQVSQKKSQVFGLNEIQEVYVMLKLSYITEVAIMLGQAAYLTGNCAQLVGLSGKWQRVRKIFTHTYTHTHHH